MCCSYLNEQAEQCGHPFCGGMTITVQGGAYVALTYSKHPGNLLNAPSGDVCEALEGINNLNNFNFTRRADTPGTPSTMNMWAGVIEAVKTTPLWTQLQQEAGVNVNTGDGSDGGDPNRKAKLQDYGYDEEAGSDGPLYAGLSIIFMGQTTVASPRELKVEDTGHVEYTGLFSAVTNKATGRFNWPYVKGGAMKLWFKNEEEHYRYRSL